MPARTASEAGRSDATAQAAKPTLFAAADEAMVRKKRRRRLFSNEQRKNPQAREGLRAKRRTFDEGKEVR
jgi:hypothetical protein